MLKIGAGQEKKVQLRLSDSANILQPFDTSFEAIFQSRKREADEFYQRISPASFSEDARNVQRQAFAGMLWTKQFYHYVVEDWLQGDPTQPPPQREYARNSEWIHLFNDDILSMPDKWEFPWFASWDLAFHTVPLAMIDPDFAKRQLDRLTREWYMHPNGQVPAYEWHFSDVNPPVHAWGTWRIYQIEKQVYGRADKDFLERVFQKLLLNFTWWVNRKDIEGNNVFQGGFLGLDNISVSKFHAENLYIFEVDGQQHRVQYEPAESTSGLFGGNSNWHGPIWFPVNFLIIESLQKFHHYLGDDFKMEYPTGSGKEMNLGEVATELSQRLMQIFLRNSS